MVPEELLLSSLMRTSLIPITSLRLKEPIIYDTKEDDQFSGALFQRCSSLLLLILLKHFIPTTMEKIATLIPDMAWVLLTLIASHLPLKAR